jgi:hypothetical protein
MASFRNRYVVKISDGGWDVVKEGHRRASAHVATQSEAVARAKALTRSAGGGEVRVLGSSGKIVAADTVSGASRKRGAAGHKTK